MPIFDTDQLAYKRLRDIFGERTSPILAWVGAGLSVPAGLPNWNMLKQALIKALEDKARGMTEDDRRATINLVRTAENLSTWHAFDFLKKELGPATYREIIRAELKPAASASVPKAYEDIWKLRVAGMINVNLDRLATQAYYKVNEHPSIEFEASRLGTMASVLQSSRPFICNLHGKEEDVASWVFTASELRDLMQQQPYKHFIHTCLTTYTVLFIGISADDIAIGGHLEALREQGIDAGVHYWVTDRRDRTTDKLAENLGIRVIRYEAPNDDHSALQGFFDDLLSFVPQEPTKAEPIVPSHVLVNSQPLAPPGDPSFNDPNIIRQVLNAEAKRLLETQSSHDLSPYIKFLADYDAEIYRAWYVNTRSGSNNLMGYRLLEERARGAFGKVYQALDSEGNIVAVKLLLEEVRNDPDVVNSFRRGIRSMRILKENDVQHMVAYQDAAEIPAYAVMDWVEGPSLAEAGKTRLIYDWQNILKIGIELADILRTAHALPARVLHRDVRPSNIMLKDFYTLPDEWNVVVLDFDLSWHKGSDEKSVTHGSTKFGYLAPEQILTIPGASTRNAAVDSYGVGMTLYYMISGQNPVPLQNQHKDWSSDIHNATQGLTSTQWKSLPQRFERIILNATVTEQSQRWDMTQILRELQRLQDARSEPKKVVSAELLAEELAARSFDGRYEWDDNRLTAITRLASGVLVEITGLESQNEVEIHFSWTSDGEHEFKRVSKWILPTLQTAVMQLQKTGWIIKDSQFNSIHSLLIYARMPIVKIREQIARQSEVLIEVATSLQLQ